MRFLLPLLIITVAAGCTEMPILFVELSNNDGGNQASISDAEAQIWIDAANDAWDDGGVEWTWDPADRVQLKSSVLNRVPAKPPEGWQPVDEDGQPVIWWPDWWYALFGNSIATNKYPDMNVVLIRWEGGGGWSWGPHDTHYVSMPMYTHTGIDKPTKGSPNTTLLAHELGHYMGLAHTFNGYFESLAHCNGTDGDEFYTGGISLAVADGDSGGQLGGPQDDVTDTPADPGAACAPTTSLACPGGSVSVNSVTFNPPWTNIMTYHDCLPETLSLGQREVVQLSLQHPDRKDRTR